jgi:hypothetical protein
MGRLELTGWVALEVGTSGTPTIEYEGFEGIPLISEDIGVEGLPVMFEYESILIIG